MTKIKKVSLWMVVACLLLSLCVGGMFVSYPKTAVAAEDLTPDFSDDFNGYGISASGKFIEDDAAFRAVWENELMLNMDGDSSAAADSECQGVAKIVSDPTAGAAAGNKVVQLNNFASGGSFFYMAPKGVRSRDFVVTYKAYMMSAEKEPWMGMSVRKSNNVRYNGCDNVLLPLKFSNNSEVSPAREAMALTAFRGYAGAGNPQDKTDSLSTTIDKPKEEWANSFSNYNGSDHVPGSNILNTWVEIKVDVKVVTEGGKETTHYSVSAKTQDNVVHELGYLNYGSSKVNGYGYMSFNACLVNMYLDDFKVTNRDTTPPPSMLVKPIVSAEVSNITSTSCDVAVLVTDPDQALVSILTVDAVKASDETDIKPFTYVDGAVTKLTGLEPNTDYKIVVRFNYDIEDGNGTIDGTCVVEMKTKAAEEKPPVTDDKKEKGCGSSIKNMSIVSILSVLAIGAVGIMLTLRKKRTNE